jgi:hypothetical protein
VAQVGRQLELEKATLLERKRREQDERKRKQEELDQILLENRRKVRRTAICTVHRTHCCFEMVQMFFTTACSNACDAC